MILDLHFPHLSRERLLANLFTRQNARSLALCFGISHKYNLYQLPPHLVYSGKPVIYS